MSPPRLRLKKYTILPCTSTFPLPRIFRSRCTLKGGANSCGSFPLPSTICTVLPILRLGKPPRLRSRSAPWMLALIRGVRHIPPFWCLLAVVYHTVNQALNESPDRCTDGRGSQERRLAQGTPPPILPFLTTFVKLPATILSSHPAYHSTR